MSWWALTAATRSAGVLRGTMRNFLQIWFLLRARQPSFGRAKKKRNRIVCYPNLTSRFPCNGNKTKGKNGKRKAPPWNDGLESWRLCLKVFPCSWSVSSLLKHLSVRLSCYKSSLFSLFSRLHLHGLLHRRFLFVIQTISLRSSLFKLLSDNIPFLPSTKAI